MDERLTPEREKELRDYLARVKCDCHGCRATGGYSFPQDRDRALLLAEIDAMRNERDALAECVHKYIIRDAEQAQQNGGGA